MLSLAKVSAAVLALVSFAQATITIATPNIKGNASNTISWTSSDLNTDPVVFSIELINEVFNSQFALANNVQTTQGSITFQMPVVAPGPGYTIEFVATGNINQIFSTSAPFSVQENDVSSSAAASATGASSSSVASVSSRTSALTSAATLTQTGTSATGTAPLSVSSASIGSTASAASSPAASASASGTSKPSGAMGLVPSGSFAAIIAGVVALLF